MTFCTTILKKIKYKKAKCETRNIYFCCAHKHIQPCTKYLQCELGYNDAPDNTTKVHVQYPLQCYDKTKKL